jgi:membrane protein required for colicin V production
MSLALLDWFILLILAAGLVRGVMAGAVRQVASLVGLLLAFVAAVHLMRPVGALAAQSLGISDHMTPLVGFVVVFLGVQMVVVALARLLEALLDTLHLSIANRIVGGAIGGVKAIVLLSVVFLVLAHVEVPGPDTRQESRLYGPVASAVPVTWDSVADYVPVVKRVSNQFGTTVRRTIPSASSAEGAAATSGSSPADEPSRSGAP